ncbi:hypothetical protein [Candidatus Cyanaurora vandensis]|uniref:hypothetical protein n=1 Tax=Candidatus Cyanaurora vandensis TaxID=2714958 RepID=UPI00257A6F7C|nr:hypothetical protein [Candidatus Cyanaurora vandensis]
MSQPQYLFKDVYRFKPNRATGGGSSYLIVRAEGNLLIDTPAWHEEHQAALVALGGVTHWIFTHRGGIGEVVPWLKVMQPAMAIHEQEAYLVNGPVAFAFGGDCDWAGVQLIWTPGHSPGSTCVLWQDILFTGRHLLPDSQGRPRPLQLAKTFHWPRQLRSVAKLLTVPFNRICPGAAVGLLRGAAAIEDAQIKLQQGWAQDGLAVLS